MFLQEGSYSKKLTVSVDLALYFNEWAAKRDISLTAGPQEKTFVPKMMFEDLTQHT